MTWMPTRCYSTAPTASWTCAPGTWPRTTPGLLLTKMTLAAYRPDADGAAFTRFLQRVQPDPAMRVPGRAGRHALEGRVVSHILPIFRGDGGNGKSTLVDAVMATLADYSDAADAGRLTARSFDAHPRGRRPVRLWLAVLHETDAGRHLAKGTVKRRREGRPGRLGQQLGIDKRRAEQLDRECHEVAEWSG